MNILSAQDAWNQLESEVCLCKGQKIRNRALCEPCFKALPEKIRAPLYRQFSESFVTAFALASKYLGTIKQ